MNYLVTHKKTGAKMLFTYDLKGVLKAFKSDFVSNKKTVAFYKNHFPFELTALQYFKENIAVFRIEEVAEDLSFQAFWQAYAHKVGNKTRAQKLWKSLTDIDKAKALSYIRVYNDHLLLNQGIQKLYPETYLSQKRFNND